MSKQVRWQVPFVSRLGTSYRVDIYDEGYTGTPVQLLGGTSPFTTDEDDSDDYFAPIRVQTGTLTVCTHDEDGNVLITLDDILPANNIAHPVQLVNVGTGSIEWQGFLSCEAYDQDYTDIPQHLQLPVISVLEAMASVEVDQTKLSGLNTVGTTIQKLLEIFIDKAGVSYFSQYYVPTVARGRNIVGKYIDATVLFEQKEYNNENSTTYIVSGMSLKDCLERIAVYMGWCVREVSSSLYFFAATESIGYRRYYRQGSIDPSTGTATYRWLFDLNNTAVVARDIAALLWAGVDHKRTVSQGAKSVEVVASLDKYELRLGMPDCPTGNVQQYTGTVFKTVQSGAGPYGQNISISAICNKDSEFTNICDFLCYQMTDTARIGNATTVENVLSCALVNPSADVYGQYYYDGRIGEYYNQYIGSFLAKIKNGENDYKDGLYIVGMREAYVWSDNAISATNHLFQIRSNISSEFINGTLKLKCDAVTIYGGDTGRVWGDYTDRTSRIRICLKFGDKYWNGSSWVSSFASFLCNENELTIPVNTRLKGEVFIRLYGYMDDWIIPADEEQGFASDMFISELSLDYEPPQSDIATDRSENHYFRLLGTNFRDEISIGTDLASMLNNQPSPSLIMNSETEAMTELNYGTTQAPDMRRPEVDLLNRLATYYGAARQRLDLIVEHPTAAPLPLLRLNGISPDSRTYAPLAESRDWQQDTSTLKCFETI